MSKIKRLRKRFTAFVNQLTPDQIREQLILAYLQMEKCQTVLKGYDVEPVKMMDNGESSDLELFYRCKKTAEELAYLNQMVHENKKVGSIELEVRVDTNPAIKSFKELKKQFEKMAESMKARVLQVGTEVYFLHNGNIHKSVVTDFVGMVEDGTPVCTVKGREGGFPINLLYATPEELVQNIGKKVQNHYSFSTDHESAYFIDHTNRVFKGAKWYLNERRITFYETIENLRESLLLNHIIDDTREWQNK